MAKDNNNINLLICLLYLKITFSIGKVTNTPLTQIVARVPHNIIFNKDRITWEYY